MFKHIGHIFLIILLIQTYGCRKETNDRRLRYVGEYKGTCEWYKTGHPELCDTGRGTSDFSFTIKLGKTDSTLSLDENEYCPVKGGGYRPCGSSGNAILFGNEYKKVSGNYGKVCQSKDECNAYKVE